MLIPLIAIATTEETTTDIVEQPEEKQVTVTTGIPVVHPQPLPKPSPTKVVKATAAGTPLSNSAAKERVVKRFGADHPLVEVARCESGYRQYRDDGSLLVNPAPNSSASGIFQILTITHGPAAKKLGLDLTTPEGNMDFAEYLYSNNGLRDWEESRHCWG